MSYQNSCACDSTGKTYSILLKVILHLSVWMLVWMHLLCNIPLCNGVVWKCEQSNKAKTLISPLAQKLLILPVIFCHGSSGNRTTGLIYILTSLDVADGPGSFSGCCLRNTRNMFAFCSSSLFPISFLQAG